jgi:hypothetical protein
MIKERINGTKAISANNSIYGAVFVRMKTFFKSVGNETSFDLQISVIQTKKKIRVTRATTVRNARISSFCATIAKKSAR